MSDRTRFWLLEGLALAIALPFLTWEGLAAFRYCTSPPWYVTSVFLLVVLGLAAGAARVRWRMTKAAEQERLLQT